ncbi:MAG TPA: PQQ-binding-like beta-propeller repeat protein [Vicinamibacterales bacterium]|nr:PQQ-binding-like beta-propeller repeat protein [Vicinamibacterales bacterium]
MIGLAALLALSLFQATIPSDPVAMRDFRLHLKPDGTFTLGGDRGWAPMAGRWTVTGDEITFINEPGLSKCDDAARYRVANDGGRLGLDVIADQCVARRMILDRSRWSPPGLAAAPVAASRRIVRTAGPAKTPLRSRPAAGAWPSFRGPEAAGFSDQQNLPDTWNPSTGENIIWKSAIPGLAHSSPIVWGDTVFVTTAISSRGSASFKPGQYGDGDASDDRSPHRWMLYAIDKRTGRIRWDRVAAQGEPRNKRHIKSTYASASPATDGRIVVAWFGSEGIHAYDFDGGLRWSVDIGRVDMGAYDIPAYEWGPASSPIIWNGLVIVQCDTQADSFLLALNAETGETVWKTERIELPSWGTPTVASTPAGPELITNASNFIRGYDPKTGRELWKLGGSSKITAPTPIFAEGLHIIASGRGPERPVFAVRPGGRGDLTLPAGSTSTAQVAWSKTGRGSYMPTPLAYRGVLYVLANNGVLDAYEAVSGKELYRQRLPLIGSGYSASPVAADGKIYLSSEDGEMLVIEAGSTFKHIATNSMGEPIMATPAMSEGVIYVRGAQTLFAIGRR